MDQTQDRPKVIVEDKQTRTWAMFCHLTALLGFIGIPLGNLLGPLVVWLLKKNEFSVVDQEGKASLNFQLTVTIGFLIAGLLCLVLIGIPLIIALVITDVVLVVIAAVKVNNGEEFKYPFAIQFLK